MLALVAARADSYYFLNFFGSADEVVSTCRNSLTT